MPLSKHNDSSLMLRPHYQTPRDMPVQHHAESFALHLLAEMSQAIPAAFRQQGSRHCCCWPLATNLMPKYKRRGVSTMQHAHCYGGRTSSNLSFRAVRIPTKHSFYLTGALNILSMKRSGGKAVPKSCTCCRWWLWMLYVNWIPSHFGVPEDEVVEETEQRPRSAKTSQM